MSAQQDDQKHEVNFSNSRFRFIVSRHRSLPLPPRPADDVAGLRPVAGDLRTPVREPLHPEQSNLTINHLSPQISCIGKRPKIVRQVIL
jgi:hypothetical protein